MTKKKKTYYFSVKMKSTAKWLSEKLNDKLKTTLKPHVNLEQSNIQQSKYTELTNNSMSS